MTYKFGKKSYLEVLEARIAPATVSVAGHVGQDIIAAVVNSVTPLKAGQTLSTQGAGGSYLLYVESGNALVFSTDLNKNGVVDSNEITGIAAGNNLSLISFVDIHGDIVTDLKGDGTLSDSDNNPSNDNNAFFGDGRDLLNTSIAKIELRSLTASDLSSDQNGDGLISDADVSARLSLSSYSIFGNVFAGSGFGSTNGTGGLLIDTTGSSLQASKFTSTTSNSIYVASTPSIGSIFVGSAASGKSFSFGASDLVAGTVGSSAALNIGGKLNTFDPMDGQAGGSIIGVSVVGNVPFNLDGLYAGGGGAGLKGQAGGIGGSIVNVTLGGDVAGGYSIIAGDGGAGPNGGKGGSITNFSDLGTSTGRVLIEAGDGGAGSSNGTSFGVGGNGGKATFGTMNIFGNVTIKMGDGGTGSNHGGNGRSLTSLNLTTGEVGSDPVSGVGVVASWRDPSGGAGDNLGRTIPIDFNHDGIGDFVFSTIKPNQLVVEISSGSGFIRYDLAVSGTPSSIAIGDFNQDKDGNGNRTYTPDIAVAYSDKGGTAGISIYTGEVQNSKFVFDEPQTSALPQLLTYGNSNGSSGIYVITGQPVTNLVSGDFNHDGKTDLALSATYTARTGQFGVTEERDLILNLQGDGTGKVFANFSNGAVPFIDVQKHSDTNFIQLQAAGLNNSSGANGSDVLFYGITQSTDFRTIYEVDYTTLTAGSPQVTPIPLGQVDTDRSDKVSSQNATLLSFTVGDLNGDGFTDVAALAQQPSNFLIIAAGGATGFAVTSGTGDQAGLQVQTGNDKFQAAGLAVSTSSGSSTNQLLLYGAVSSDKGDIAAAYTITLPKALNSASVSSAALLLGAVAHGATSTVPAFDVYRSDSNKVGVITLLDSQETPLRISPTVAFVRDLAVPLAKPILLPLAATGVVIQGGGGGASSKGIGGNGGSVGGATLGTITLNGSGLADSLDGSYGFGFYAGNGGAGLLAGGSGGGLSGIKAVFDDPTKILPSTLAGGVGGFSGDGKGGLGGSVYNNSIQGGAVFSGGNGGGGKRGGNGGAVVGKGDPNDFDTSGGGVIVQGGNGGIGTVSGGLGGSVVNFVNYLYIVTLGGLVSYTAGDGGDGGSGAGGAGGSVLNSSPSTLSNGFGGEIFLKGGDGGAGTLGGKGGKVKAFSNESSEGNPNLVTALGGDGGFGTNGAGGAGGNVVNVQASGAAFDSNTSTTEADLILGGAGGESETKKGGVGGSVVGAGISAAGGAVVISAGVGGDGGKTGGAGGSVTTVKAAAAQASTGGGGIVVSKVLITAGAGGDGGTAGSGGFGGLGGSIFGVRQTGNVLTNVDLVAGNGGNVQSGTAADSKVGRGGSISNVNLAGTIGDTSVSKAPTESDPTPMNPQPIVSYGLMAAEVEGLRNAAIDHNSDLIDFPPSGSGLVPAAQLTNADGNVGLVAGAAGLLNGATVAGEKNGSVTSITARAIMSMIAGNVDNIASIQQLKNVHISVPAQNQPVFGADKGMAGKRDYLTAQDVSTDQPVIGGKLVDGAIISKNTLKNDDGTKPPVSTREFVLNG